MSRIALAAAFIAILLSDASAQQRTVNVFAAVSLTNALDDIDAAFTQSTSTMGRVRFGASSTVAEELKRFLTPAVLISANPQSMDDAEADARIDHNTRVNLLGNSLVLIASTSSPIDPVAITKGFDLASLAGDGLIAVADVNTVPAGIYAKSALISLGAWTAAEPKLIMAENVRRTLDLVAGGYASVGIVYATEAKVDPEVKIVGTFANIAASQITYPAAATIGADPDTLSYLHFLRSAQAKAIFKRYGFRCLE
jgi:molybdate transport system substrate-binding protein